MGFLDKLRGKKQTHGLPPQDAQAIFDRLDQMCPMANDGKDTWKGNSICSKCGGMDQVRTSNRENYLPGGRKAFCAQCKSPIEYKWVKA